MTKQEQKNEAFKTYETIRDQAFKTYETIIAPAKKTYLTIIDPAKKTYLAKCEEIDAQEDEIKIIDGKRYKLID